MLHAIHLTSQGGDHAEHTVPENSESVIYFILSSWKILNANFQVPTSPYRAIVKDPFPRKFSNINIYFYIICQYYKYSQRQGSVGYPNQDSINFFPKTLVHHEVKKHCTNVDVSNNISMLYGSNLCGNGGESEVWIPQ